MRATIVAVLLCLPVLAAAQDRTFPVASWIDDAAHARAGDRVVAAMRSGGLHPVVTCSAGCTLSVPSREYDAAQVIVQQVVAREHLDVEVLGMVTTS